MFQDEEDKHPTQTSVDVKQPPPATFHDWLIANNLDDWPLEIEEDPTEFKFQVSPESLGVGSQEEIQNEIKNKSSFQIGILDELLEQLAVVEDKVADYASYFFGESKKKKPLNRSATCDNEKYRASIDIVLDQDAQRHEKIKEMFSFKLKNFEHAVFPGYFEHEVTPLPGSLEAPQLLNHVTRLKDFNTGYRKTWRKYFLSEPSVAIMQDAFWWVFLDHKKLKNSEDQSKLFNRLANSFVSLFLSVPNSDKDLFFKYYPDCLSQAIYAGFCAAFEASSSKFNEQFRTELLALMYEWMTGTHPYIGEILKHWNLEALESKTMQDNGDEKPYVLKASLSFDENTFLDTSPRKISWDDEAGLNLFSPKQTKKAAESHPVGAGPSFERLAFNLHGRSPFIMHYLASKDLQHEEEVLRKIVTRTQVNERIRTAQETYDDLITKHKKKSTTRDLNYKSITNEISKEFQNVERQKRKDIKAMEKLQAELLTQHLDIKILSEKIMDMMDKSSFAPRKVSTEPTEEQTQEE